MAMALLLVPATAWASDEGEEETLDPIHHSADGYYLDFEPLGKLELPRIFFSEYADGTRGLDFYGSTLAAINSGAYEEEVIEGAEDDGHGSHLDAHLVPAGGGHIIVDFSITRHLIFAWIGTLLVLFIFITLAGRYKRGIGRDTAPRGRFQNMFETLVLFVRDEIARPNLGPKTDIFLPYLLTAFFFILICNLLGLVPFGATATSNLMVTAVLAFITFVLTQVYASKDYWMHIFWPPGIPTFAKPILIPVELLGIFAKPFALAIRLFANMTAGHLIILSLIGLIFTSKTLFGTGISIGVAPVSVAFALFIYLLELLVASIQAYIFVMLSALFIGMAVEEHDHHHEEHHAAHAPAALPTGETLLVSQDGAPAMAPASEPEPALAS